MSLRALALLSLLALPLGSCSPERGAPSRPNVLLILVDTLRADRLSAYGYDRPTSPFLEELARESLLFENVYAQAGCTFPSVNSIFTSRYTTSFLAEASSTWGIPSDQPSLPTILRAEGYVTAAVSASPVVRATPSNINRTGGFGNGFDQFDESCLNQSAACVNEQALRFLDGVEEPYFLYLHYMDPHGPYQPPPEHNRQFAAEPPPNSPRFVRLGNPHPVARAIREGNLPLDVPADQIAHLRDLYDEEVLYLDSQLRSLVHSLTKSGHLENTIVVVMSDHGEEMLEHQEWSHCRNLIFETVMHVPLLIRFPDGPVGVIGEPIENLDVTPTLLDRIGIDTSTYSFQGRDRVVAASPAEAVHHAFMRQGVFRAVTDGRLKLVLDVASGDYQLFDLSHDPLERTNLAPERPEDFRKLRRALLTWLRAEEGEDLGKGSVNDAERLEQELRALGYLG